MEKIIDLHIHSNLSDGFLSPKEIIDTAYNNGVSVISICDHDTTEAYTQELFDYADSKKIKIIKEFKGYHYTLVEVFQILDDLKRDLSGLAVEQELKKMKFRRK